MAFLSLLLLATPLVALADVTTMTLVHPTVDQTTNTLLNTERVSPFFWHRQSGSSISMADIAQSSLRLMGAAPLSVASAKHLPSPDVISPPEAVFMLAIDSATAADMPMLQALLSSAGVEAQVRHSNSGFDLIVDQLSTALASLDTQWQTHCASSIESTTSLPCQQSARDSVDSADSTLQDDLAALKHLAASTHQPRSLYVATVGSSGAASSTEADSVVMQAIKDLATAHKGAMVLQVVELSQRRLLATSTLAPTATPTATQLSIQEISTYQICLWTGVGLALVLLSAICCMVNMDIRPDSLLYAKFQADVSSKSE